MEGVDWAEARPGDVVFFAPETGDPVSEWIAEADTGAFSHVGMFVGNGDVLNAALARRETFDLGGVIVLSMQELVRGRSGPPYLGRPAVDTSHALEAARPFIEGETRRDLHKSGFSVSKSLLMMAALCAAHSGDNKLKDLTLRAGGLWSVDAEIQSRETPSFICAEFVAQCYGIPFRWSDLEGTLKAGQVPDAPPQGSGPSDIADFTEHRGGDTSGFIEEAHDVFDHTFRQELALARVFERLMHKHGSFLIRCLKSGGELLVPSVSHAIHAAKHHDDDGDALSDLSESATDDPELPFCLVTPRTLSEAEWFEWVRPIRFS